jgi:hypothetical protein
VRRRDVFKAAASVPAVALAQNTNWQPMTLDNHQNETVIALTDLIIPATDTPGAKEANVNRYIDLFLTDGDAAEREKFLAGLGWLDRLAREAGGKTFRESTRDEQTALLREMDQGAAPAPAKEFFRQAKAMTSRIYYATAIGFRELNKGGRVPGSFACQA